jgi:hypothetical protein
MVTCFQIPFSGQSFGSLADSPRVIVAWLVDAVLMTDLKRFVGHVRDDTQVRVIVFERADLEFFSAQRARFVRDGRSPSSVAAPSPRARAVRMMRRRISHLTLSPEVLTPDGGAPGRDYAQRRIVLEYEA